MSSRNSRPAGAGVGKAGAVAGGGREGNGKRRLTRVTIPTPLGMTFASNGSGGIVVTKLKEEGNALATGKVNLFMEILSVNGTAVHGLEKAEVATLIKASKEECTIEFGEDEEGSVGGKEYVKEQLLSDAPDGYVNGEAMRTQLLMQKQKKMPPPPPGVGAGAAGLGSGGGVDVVGAGGGRADGTHRDEAAAAAHSGECSTAALMAMRAQKMTEMQQLNQLMKRTLQAAHIALYGGRGADEAEASSPT